MKPRWYIQDPMFVGALLVWATNDHVIKLHAGGWVSGKLSDVACLVAFPMLLVGTWEWGLIRRPVDARVRVYATCIASAIAALVMTTINTLDVAADVYRVGLGVAQWPFRALATWGGIALRPVELTMDRTDLWTYRRRSCPSCGIRAQARARDCEQRTPRQAQC